MPKKCADVDCRKDGKNKIVTIDNSALYVCDEHLGPWISSGCLLAEKTSKKVSGLVLKYGIYSAFFVVGFSLILYMMVTWINQYGVSPYTLEIWLGLAFIIVSWIISSVNIKRTAQKIKMRP